MTFPVLLNPLFQMAAAFVIFFAGFITLFSFLALCVVVGWALYHCTNRLAVLISRSHEGTSPMLSDADSRTLSQESATNPFNHAPSQVRNPEVKRRRTPDSRRCSACS